LLVEHGIRRAMNVILQGDGSPFGVLEVDSQSEGEFSETPPSLNVHRGVCR
jgi:putative methionine-R-sulfoxide reductase with GAF domain